MSEGRVYLRPITAADTAQIVAWRNRDFVRKNFIYQKPFTKKGHTAWLREQVEPGHVAQFIICVTDGIDCPENPCAGWDIGSVYLRDIDREAGTAEYGVFIGEKDALGQGYGTAAAKLTVAYGFETLHLKKFFCVFWKIMRVRRKAMRKRDFGWWRADGKRSCWNRARGKCSLWSLDARSGK